MIPALPDEFPLLFSLMARAGRKPGNLNWAQVKGVGRSHSGFIFAGHATDALPFFEYLGGQPGV